MPRARMTMADTGPARRVADSVAKPRVAGTAPDASSSPAATTSAPNFRMTSAGARPVLANGQQEAGRFRYPVAQADEQQPGRQSDEPQDPPAVLRRERSGEP